MKDEESWPESFKEISGEDFIAEKRRPDFERDLNDMLPEWLLARVRIAIRDDAGPIYEVTVRINRQWHRVVRDDFVVRFAGNPAEVVAERMKTQALLELGVYGLQENLETLKEMLEHPPVPRHAALIVERLLGGFREGILSDSEEVKNDS